MYLINTAIWIIRLNFMMRITRLQQNLYISYTILTQFCIFIIHSTYAAGAEPCIDTVTAYDYLPANEVGKHLILDRDQASLIVAAKADNPSKAYEFYSQGK
jgi:hypothetical protein